MRTIAAILGLAGVAAAGEPGADAIKITKDYGAEFNATVRALPEGDLAKPLLCRAWKAMKPWPGEPAEHPALVEPAEGTPAWGAAQAWLRDNTEALDLLRKAGEKPRAGWLLQDALEPGLRDAVGGEAKEPRVNPELPSVLLAYLGPSRQSSRLLAVDAIAARRAGEPERWRADVAAMLGLGSQMLDRPLVIEQVIGRVSVLTALTEVRRAVRDRPAGFGDAVWAGVAERLDRLREGRGLGVHAEGERWMVMDAIQRSYTDDGRGDGRINREGWRYLWGFMRSTGGGLGFTPAAEGEDDAGRADVVYGMYAGQFASRQAETELADTLFGRLDAWGAAVVGRADFAEYDKVSTAVEKARTRHPTLALFLTDLRRYYEGQEWPRQDLDGVRLVVAAERSRRKHGRVPASAAELVPEFLNAVPTDRWTGGPLFYAARGDGFTVYSAGPDQDDDHGVAVSEYKGFWPEGEWWKKPPASRAGGDYVIFPAPD